MRCAAWDRADKTRQDPAAPPRVPARGTPTMTRRPSTRRVMVGVPLAGTLGGVAWPHGRRTNAPPPALFLAGAIHLASPQLRAIALCSGRLSLCFLLSG